VADKWYIVDYGSKARLDKVVDDINHKAGGDEVVGDKVDRDLRWLDRTMLKAQRSGSRLVANSRLLAMLDEKGFLPEDVASTKTLKSPRRGGIDYTIVHPRRQVARILESLEKHGGTASRSTIANDVGMSIETHAQPFERALVAGLVEHKLRGPYSITRKGEEVLDKLSSGKSVTIRKSELDPEWSEYFSERTW